MKIRHGPATVTLTDAQVSHWSTYSGKARGKDEEKPGNLNGLLWGELFARANIFVGA